MPNIASHVNQISSQTTPKTSDLGSYVGLSLFSSLMGDGLGMSGAIKNPVFDVGVAPTLVTTSGGQR